MNLADYELTHYPVYEAFAETVRFITEKALLSAQDAPFPQSIQCRAKGIESLRRRLAENDNLDTQTLETDRRDLAGVRLIFYTNNDVDRFIASTLVRDNFVIEEDSTKIHHPLPENEGARYRAVHYTVRLGESRTCLPEYAKFADMRCEIQVQTILNHAWSETSHDILYKKAMGDGYGEKAMKGVAKRFERIMDKYLIPAGFEIQKAQQEYERILHGKELFDNDITGMLDNAQNNNERYEILSRLKDYAIPNYDNLLEAYEGLKAPLISTVNAARNTESVPIETTYGNMQGFKSDAVIKLVLEIVESLRYVDPKGTLLLLIDIYRNEPNEDIREQIINVVKNLSEYNLDVYKQVGPALQVELLDLLSNFSDAEVDNIRPIALKIWTEAIQSDVTGTQWKTDSVIFSTGAVTVSDQLLEIRNKAIDALFEAFDRSTNDRQKREILLALDAATRTPNQGQFSNALLAITLKDSKRIVDHVSERATQMSFELLQHLEHRFLYDYYRTKEIAEDPENRFECQTDAIELVSSIFKFRDQINADSAFIRYKILVGFESVYPSHWKDEKFDFQAVDEYRRGEANRYIDEINDENEDELYALIERCAETKSNDLATFPVFGRLISNLAERKPEIANRFLAKASNNLRMFIPSFLNGLALSGRNDIYERIVTDELESANNLVGLGRHFRFTEINRPGFVYQLLKRAIEENKPIAVIECLLIGMKYFGTETITAADAMVHDALTFLNDRKDSRWVSEASFLENASNFYETLGPETTAQILENLSYQPQVTYDVDRVLARLAERYPEEIWDFFGTRLSKEASLGKDEEEYDAIPFQLHDLEKELSKNPKLAISKGLLWYVSDSSLFQFRGGRLLSRSFPDCKIEFANVLVELVKGGGETEAKFTLAILQNYAGEVSIGPVLKEIVSMFPDDKGIISSVSASIDNTGVVSGELGLAEAWRQRKEILTEWLSDDRPEVIMFAQKHIAELDLLIASDHRRAETDREMRQRNFEDEAQEKAVDGAGASTE